MKKRRVTGPDVVRRSDGLLIGVLGDQVVACDTLGHKAHIVDGLLGWLLLLDDPTPFAELAADVVATTGAAEASVTEQLREAVDLGSSLRLLGRRIPAPHTTRSSVISPTSVGSCHSQPFAVLDQVVAFSCNDRNLVAQIDELLGCAVTDQLPTQWLNVSEIPTGEVLVGDKESLRFDSRSTFVSQLVRVLNQVAARSPSLVVLTAGAVRTAAGELWLLPSASVFEHQVLIGALIQAGCDYLGAEVVGLRSDEFGIVDAVGCTTPLPLDANSRVLLGLQSPGPVFTQVAELRGPAEQLAGEHGPIDRVLFCEVVSDQPQSVSRLDPTDAVRSLLTCGVNLAAAPHSGVQTLCDLAAGPPSLRIKYHDPAQLAQVLTSQTFPESPEDLERRLGFQRRAHSPAKISHGDPIWGQIKVRRSSAVASRDIEAGAERTTFVIDRTGRTAWALTGLARRIWRTVAIEYAPPPIDLIRSGAGRFGGNDEHLLQTIGQVLVSMVEQGLLVQAGSGDRSSIDSEPGGVSSHDGDMGLRRFGESRPVTATAGTRAPWRILSREGHGVDWLGHRLVTDVESIRRMLVDMRGASAVPADSLGEADRALIEVRSTPGSNATMLIRLNGLHLWWLNKADCLSMLGVILANLASDDVFFGQSLGETSVIAWPDGCLLHVGAHALAGNGEAGELVSAHQARIFGARVEQGKTVLLPDSSRAAAWLAGGAHTDEVMDLWQRCTLKGVVVEGASDIVGGWLRTLIELCPWQQANGRFLSELMANGDVPLTIVRRGEALSILAESLPLEGDPSEGSGLNRRSVITPARRSAGVDSESAAVQAAVWTWATSLGKASWAEESARISRDHVVLGRKLLRIRLNSPHDDKAERTAAVRVDSVVDAITDLGLDLATATEIAQASVAVGTIYLGFELAGGLVRRKLYVRGIGDPAWAVMSRDWPGILTEDAARPSWIAWKWTEGRTGELQRSTYRGHLGGASTVGHQVDSILDTMGSAWNDVMAHLLTRLGIERLSAPSEGDLLTLDEDGRRSVDISGVGSARWRWHDMEPELRWLAAVAKLNKEATDELMVWSQGCRLSRLIFGTDRRGEPFVNLYVARA